MGYVGWLVGGKGEAVCQGVEGGWEVEEKARWWGAAGVLYDHNPQPLPSPRAKLGLEVYKRCAWGTWALELGVLTWDFFVVFL